MRLPILLALALAATPASPYAAPVPAAITLDPTPDKARPAGIHSFALPTHGVNINAVLYTAAGAGPHPTVLMLHGLPGNEQNLDVAQAMRRAGWNVLTLHYRGAWGSPGEYSFTHCIEDAQAALIWLRAPANAKAHGIDPAKLVVVGHSLGGFVSAYLGGHDRDLLGTGLVSAANLGREIGGLSRAQAIKVVDDNIGTSAGMHTLATTPQALADEAIAHGKDWNFVSYAPGLALHPLLLVTSDDGLAGASAELAKAVGPKGVTQVHLATDHSYSDHRIAMETAILDWLATLPGAPKP